MDCLFCKIINKEIPAHIIYEDDEVVAFLDIHPCALGHTVIVPKIHVNNILDLPDEKIGSVFERVKKLTGLLEKVLDPDGFTIGINHKEAAGQIINHLHIHIIPRWSNDGGGSIHSVVNNPPRENLEEIAALLKKSI